MKFFAVIGALVAGSIVAATSASAADLAARPFTKAPPLVAVYDWTGFYIGANGGYGSARKCWDRFSTAGVALVATVAEGCHDADGGMGGGQFGYRWQSAQFVWGIDLQGDAASFRGQNPSLFPVAGVATDRTRINALGLVTGSVGLAFNNVLLSVRGGYAVIGDRYTGVTTATGIAFDRARETRSGAAVGLGIEYGLTPNLSFAVLYDHGFFGDRNIAFTSIATGGPSRGDRIQQDIDMVTARVNWRWSGPVVAKY